MIRIIINIIISFTFYFTFALLCCVNIPREDFRELSPHFLFGIFEALSHKVDGLVLCDWVLLQAGLAGVKGQHLGFVRQAVLSGRKRNRNGDNHTSNMRNYRLQREL